MAQKATFGRRTVVRRRVIRFVSPRERRWYNRCQHILLHKRKKKSPRVCNLVSVTFERI